MTYDRWLIWNFEGPCNLRCEYCLCAASRVSQRQSVDVAALMRTFGRHTYHITFSGGCEPFLIRDFVDVCQTLTERHYVSINTNLSTRSVETFASVIDSSRVPYIVASLHYQQLVERGLLDRFLRNYDLLHARGHRVTVLAIAYPPHARFVGDMLRCAKRHGIEIDFHPFFGALDGKEYPASYTYRQRRPFRLPATRIRKHNRRGQLCNAGYNVAYIRNDGSITPCVDVPTKLGQVYEGVTYNDAPLRCPVDFCHCPIDSARPRYREALWRFGSATLRRMSQVVTHQLRHRLGL